MTATPPYEHDLDCDVCQGQGVVPVGEYDAEEPLIEAEDLMRCPACSREAEE